MSDKDMDEQAVHKMWPNVPRADLFRFLNEDQKRVFLSLEKMEANPVRCDTVKSNLYFNLSTGNFEGMKEQFQQLGCCRSTELNYVGAKVVARIESYLLEKRDNPEEAGVNYYRQFVESSMQRHIRFLERARIYHDVNANWIYATYAALVGVPSIVVFKKHSTAAKDFFKKASIFDPKAKKN